MSDSNSFCVMSSSIWQFIGYILFALKIIVPLIIIILGVIDFVKAITSSKDDAAKSAAKNLGLRIVVGLAIFFIPLIISTVFKFIKEASPYIAAADGCQRCLLRPFTDECEGYKATAQAEREAQKEAQKEEGGQKVQKNHCYFVYNGGDTDGKYIWGIEGTRGYDYPTLIARFDTEERCLNPLNSTKVLNYTTKPIEGTGGNSSGGFNPNGDYLKFYDALTILHSGQAGALDNSRELFENAGKAKFYGAECDLTMSNNSLWCRHTTGNAGLSFEEYMKICNQYKMISILDIKSGGNTYFDAIADYIKENNAQDHVIIQTSVTSYMDAMTTRVPDVKIWYLLMDPDQYSTFNSLDYDKYNIVGINIEKTISNETYIKNYLAKNLEVCVFSFVNWPDEDKKKFSDYGINYIMTNSEK